jgi:hypothetical protein
VVITTADLWVERLLLPPDMVAPSRTPPSRFGRRSHKNSERQAEDGLLCEIVTTLIQTVKKLKTYAFEDVNRIPEV